MLHSYVRFRLDPRLRRLESASDIVQSALREVLEHPGNFDYQGPNAFRAFLVRAVEHKLANKRRYWDAQRRATGAIEPVDDLDALPESRTRTPTPSEVALETEALERLASALDELGEEDRRIITMRRFADLPADLIAAELGIATSTVRQRLARIMTFLGRRLGHGDGVGRDGLDR